MRTLLLAACLYLFFASVSLAERMYTEEEKALHVAEANPKADVVDIEKYNAIRKQCIKSMMKEIGIRVSYEEYIKQPPPGSGDVFYSCNHEAYTKSKKK